MTSQIFQNTKVSNLESNNTKITLTNIWNIRKTQLNTQENFEDTNLSIALVQMARESANKLQQANTTTHTRLFAPVL